ncbi:hypothetical protein ElyMa_001630600 [Elysia marginata]|uniref:Uncharacterized protein n=1 Tax=Elysia marginata TaxID=1093978 RepID=A0AAV4JLB9_9GAST|nr:hypothetical protein ElyMa_001630600 [Elysia marginata]
MFNSCISCKKAKPACREESPQQRRKWDHRRARRDFLIVVLMSRLTGHWFFFTLESTVTARSATDVSNGHQRAVALRERSQTVFRSPYATLNLSPFVESARERSRATFGGSARRTKQR